MTTNKKTDKNKKSRIILPGDSIVTPCLPGEIPEYTRRQMLLGGASLFSYVSLAKLLGLDKAHAQTATFPPQKKLIWIQMNGGWDILEVTDPKVSSTANIDMSYSWGEAHAFNAAGDKIGRWLPNVASIGNDLLVVRGLNMATTSHNAGRVFADTGIRNNTGEVNGASIPAIIAADSTATIPIIQLQGGSEPLTDRAIDSKVSVVRADNLELFKSMYPETDTQTQRAIELLDYVKSSVTRFQAEVGTNDRLSNFSTAEDKVRTQINANLAAQLTVTDSDRASYTTDAPASLSTRDIDSFALAEKLVTGDLVTAVNIGMGGFDTHTNQNQRLQPILERFDHLLSTLVSNLRAAGELDNTLIVVFSDFGRTPRVNGGNGRDHWPIGGALMIGGGIDGGRVVGGTTDGLQGELINATSGLVDASGIQIDPSYVGGSVLELVLGASFLSYRTYLNSIAALTRLKS